MRVVVDTNVIVAALRSSRGASNAFLCFVASGHIEVALSTALCLEYEEVLLRPGMVPFSAERVGVWIDSLCSVAYEAPIFYRWRPFLQDPSDDLVVECALSAGAAVIVTYNGRHFAEVETLGISCVTPGEFLVTMMEES